MALYNVEVIEELSRVVEQEANSYEEAKDLVEARYDNEDIVLDWNDLNDTKYKPYPSQEIVDDFEVNVVYNSKEHFIMIYNKYGEAITTDSCKTSEELVNILSDFFKDYLELAEIKSEEKNKEIGYE